MTVQEEMHQFLVESDDPDVNIYVGDRRVISYRLVALQKY